jgi:hypothetical protein
MKYSPFIPLPLTIRKSTLILDLDDPLNNRSTFQPHSKIESFQLGDPPFDVFKRPGLIPFLELVNQVLKPSFSRTAIGLTLSRF